jgi:FemAB-related protein (PEP-CTERM system-associated)
VSTTPAAAGGPPSQVSLAAAEALEIRPARAADDAPRDALVRALPGGSPFHLSAWRRAVERCFGHEPCDLVASEGGRLVGVLPLMRVRSPFGARALLSVPYAVYGGAVATRPEIEMALVRSAMQQAARERVRRLELRNVEPPAVEGLVAYDLYATFVRELPPAPEKVLEQMPKKARAEARKARERHGLRLREGGWYLDDLVRLFHHNKRALGSPALPREFFFALAEGLAPDVRVHAVHHGGAPIAAVMSFLWRDTLLAYYAGSAEGVDRELSASNFMYMALQEWAVERGLRRFDFGRSRKDAGAFQFKRHQGFEPRDLPYRVQLVTDRELPSFNPSNPRTHWMQQTWRRLPLWATVRLSSTLARYLP